MYLSQSPPFRYIWSFAHAAYHTKLFEILLQMEKAKARFKTTGHCPRLMLDNSCVEQVRYVANLVLQSARVAINVYGHVSSVWLLFGSGILTLAEYYARVSLVRLAERKLSC